MHRYLLLLCFYATLSITLLPLPALAILTDEESEALEQTYKSYQKAKSAKDLVERLRSGLDLKTLLFLREKTKLAKNQALPKMTVHKSSRVSFKVNSKTFTVDFISLRSELIAINGIEVEFMPSDDPEVRFQKLVQAFRRSTAAVHPLLKLLDSAEERASAKSNTKPRKVAAVNVELTSDQDIILQLSALITAITQSAQFKSQCADLSSAQTKPDTIPESLLKCQTAQAELSGGSVVDSSLIQAQLNAIEDSPAFQPIPKCDPVSLNKVEDLLPEVVIAFGGQSRKNVESTELSYVANNAGSDHISLDQLRQIKEAGNLPNHIKARLQGLRDLVVQFKDSSKYSLTDQERECQNKVRDCVVDVMTGVRKRLKDNDLICFTEKMQRDVSKSSTNPPGGKARPANY